VCPVQISDSRRDIGLNSLSKIFDRVLDPEGENCLKDGTEGTEVDRDDQENENHFKACEPWRRIVSIADCRNSQGDEVHSVGVVLEDFAFDVGAVFCLN
jgi:hypothetical protein